MFLMISVSSALPRPGTRTLVYGHRGAMAYAPQNTMPSFELAWEQGAHGIELDVQCSRDGVPVVFHDDSLDSLTDGSGPVFARDLEDLRRLDAGSHFSPAFRGERIPLFETVLRARPAGTFINIELKTALPCDPLWRQMLRPFTGYAPLVRGSGPEREAEAVRVAAATARCIADASAGSEDLVSHLIVSSFDPVALSAFGAAFPGIPLAFLYYRGVAMDTRVMMKDIAHQAWHPYFRETGKVAVEAAHGRGQLVNCWTVNQSRCARRLVAMGVDGLITNRPDAMLALVQRGRASDERHPGLSQYPENR
jgi:glycerophosphoryl diester phosphodiesterase